MEDWMMDPNETETTVVLDETTDPEGEVQEELFEDEDEDVSDADDSDDEDE